MNLRQVYEAKGRDPRYYPLFEQCWEVLCMAPSSQHADEDELISLTWDAFDYLQADGRWYTQSQSGRTEMHLNGGHLRVVEQNGQGFNYEHTFTLQ